MGVHGLAAVEVDGQALQAPARLAVAYSGGRDSTALLHALWRAVHGLPVELHALHVHHGLSPHADAWARHCRDTCRRWSRRGPAIHFQMRRVHLERAGGDSLEALAREARYAALTEMARAAGVERVLLAQHADDQAETVMLQALRGAGAAGLAAMPGHGRRDGLCWVRPWLAQPRSAIQAYVDRHRLRHVEDESNGQRDFARNRLRLDVWPALLAAFPDANRALAQVARHAQDALACLDDLAELDLMRARCDGGGLDVVAVRALSAARQRNLLRRWLPEAAGRRASGPLIERIVGELGAVTAARWPAAGGGWVLCERGRLLWLPSAATGSVEALPARLCISGPGRVPLPAWGGALVVEAAPAADCDADPWQAVVRLQWPACLLLRPRQPQDRFQRHPAGPPRSLKKAFQSAGVPARLRVGPVVCAGDGALLFVPGLGLDARAWAAIGDAGWRLRWEPDAARYEQLHP